MVSWVWGHWKGLWQKKDTIKYKNKECVRENRVWGDEIVVCGKWLLVSLFDNVTYREVDIEREGLIGSAMIMVK